MQIRLLYLGPGAESAQRVYGTLRRSKISCEAVLATTVPELRNAIQTEDFDCILIDDAGGINALRAVRAARRLTAQCPILVLSHEPRDELVVQVIRAGAVDCVASERMSRLPLAVRRTVRAADRARKLNEAEEALRASEERYRAFIANSSEGIWRIDFDEPIPIDLTEQEQIEWFYRQARMAECNDAVARMYGFRRGSQMAGLRVEEILPRSEENVAHLQQVIRSGYRLSDAETIEHDRDGNVKHILNNVIGIIQDGKVVRVWGTQRDITCIRRTEHEIRESESRLRAVLESAIDAIVTVGSGGAIVEFNPAAEHVFGRRREDVIGKSAVEILVPARLRSQLERELQRYLATGESPAIGQHIELPGLRADGAEFPAEITITLTGLPGPLPLATVFVRDITDRVEAEAQFQRQLDERESMCELSEAVSRALGVNDVTSIAIDALKRLLGADRASVLLLDSDGTMRFKAWRGLSDDYRAAVEGHSPWSLADPNPRPILMPNIEAEDSLGDLRGRILGEGIRALAFVPLVYESRLLGKFMVYHNQPHQFTDDEIRVAQLLANHVAVAIHSKGREQAAEHQRAFLKLVLDINPNLIFAKDREGRFTLANRAVAEIYGTTPEDLLGRTDADFNPNGEEVEHFRGIDLKVMDTLVEHACEEVVTDAAGNVHHLHTVKRPIIAPDGKASQVLGVAVDITERKRAEDELLRHREHLEELVSERTRELERSHEQLRHSERMAMIGTLSTGLGHDMGNLLLPLRVRLDAMEARGLPVEFREDTRAIRTFAEYLQRLSNGLRLLALDPHEPGHLRDTTDLHEWWLDVQPVLKNALPSGIVLEVDFQHDLPRPRIARHVLTQIIFNLVQNAGEAMAERREGTVTVWSEKGADDAHLRIGVTDTGPGMPPEVAARCMEPFFTTKTRGISTGLGLALVHGLAQKSEGSLDVDSQPGQGTTFTLYVPAEKEQAARSGLATRRPRAVASLRDPRIRGHVISVLRSLGFEVESVEKPTDPGVDVWIADGGARSLRLVREFASAGEHKHALVFGAVPMGEDYSRITQLPERPKPSEIWRAVRSIAEQFELERKDSGA